MIKDGFPIQKCHFTLQAVDDIFLPKFKGSDFHGGFGNALHRISQRWYRYFFETGKGAQQDAPKPFVILPPLDELTVYPKGQQFALELTLFGEAARHHSICESAIETLGTHLGLGYQKGKFNILDVGYSQPDRLFCNANTGAGDANTAAPQQLRLSFPTRLRLKADNRLCKNVPSFQLLISRLLGRLKTLQGTYADSAPEPERYRELIDRARHIRINHSHLHWNEWDRFSGRQKSWMKFGGLLGDITYCGHLEPFLPYLRLGQWLHIGGKTSFGLGKYTLEPTHG